MSDVKTFLEKIQEIEADTVQVYIPSKHKTFKSKTLTFKQQKDIISTIADGSSGILKFHKIINDILIENVGNVGLVVSDKIPAILAIRNASVGSNLRQDGSNIDLSTALQSISSVEYPTSKEFESAKGLKITLESPSLAEESKVIQSAIESLKRSKQDVTSKTVGDIYVYEIIKFVKSIQMGEDTINFSEIPISSRVEIINSLPILTNKEIISFIQNIKEIDRKVLTFNVNGETLYVDMDVNFFDP